MTYYYTAVDYTTSSGTCTTANSTTAGNYTDWDRISMMTGTASAALTTMLPWEYYIVSYPIGQRQEPAREQISQELLDQRNAEAQRKVDEQHKADTEAAAKAKILLLEYLDDENKKRLLDNKPLEIVSRLFSDVRYHIPISKLCKIKAWKENKIITELCLTVKEHERLPIEDVVLTKLLHTLHDEENMLRTANHFNIQENLLARLN